MKYKLLWAFYLLFFIAVVTLFRPMAAHPMTFTQLAQNPEQTMKKYESLWDDKTIQTAATPKFHYQLGDQIATITIPKMDYYEMPVYYGSDPVNNNWQITAPGHLGNWNLFGEQGRSAVGAHNYQLFTRLPELEIGDKFIVENEIDVYVYEVVGTAIFDHTKDDWTQLAYQIGEDYSVTLMTCYPIDAIETQDMYLVYTKLCKGTIFEK